MKASILKWQAVFCVLSVLVVSHAGHGATLSVVSNPKTQIQADIADCKACTAVNWPRYKTNPKEIHLELPIRDRLGGIFAHELDGDGMMDYVITMSGHIAAYSHQGTRLWHHRDNIILQRADSGLGYPGMHHPGAIAGDVDGDGQVEVAYLLYGGELIIRDGSSGVKERSYRFPGANGLAIADFRGRGDRDAVIQYDQRRLRGVNLESGGTLWEIDDWWGVEHSLVRTMDLNGDGKDEVLGPIILNHEGKVLHKVQREGADLTEVDSLAVGDIIPGGEVEIVLAEQRGNNETIVMGPSQTYWGKFYRTANGDGAGKCRFSHDPDKVATGDFDLSRVGLEVFARSSCGNHPWIMDNQGTVIASWNVADTAPEGWCYYRNCRVKKGQDTSNEFGVDLVRSVVWHGSGPDLLFVKERHVAGKIALVDALTGEFVRVWDTAALRSYAADVAGDYREELMVLEKTSDNTARLLIFFNEKENSIARPRLWSDRLYRRIRQNWNYYSP